ncbi:MAG TPA: glycosyltransferase family 2 protein [Patescibacteria group bacterium]|jgi:glycosyltransferase involved in cell wall biosynthesis|nr:glycosyltransferase family 2 protein [Patescibacteria group bacterium]
MKRRILLSAIVIARNEAKRLEGCLQSLSWADECIVIDNASTDETALIAKKCGAIVVNVRSNNFSLLRNNGAKAAHGIWLLYVDADELVPPPLREEIMSEITGEHASRAYFIPRQNYYLGLLWPSRDGMVRLIRNDALSQWDGVLHEHAVVHGPISTLRNCFIHKTHRTLEEMVDKTNKWSALEAELRFKSHHPLISWWRLLRVMMTAFFDSFIRQGGWKAGTVGLIESIYQAFSMFITYAKLWELQKRTS